MKRSVEVLAIILVWAVFAWPINARAQQTESRIIGKVYDSSKGALPGVSVTVMATQTGAVRTLITDGDGSYTVTNLAPGGYALKFELSGFATYTRDLILGLGQQESLDVALGIATLQEAVAVTADAAVLDLSSARIGVNVSPEEVGNLPVNGRNFANLMTLATGATTDGNGGWASVRFNGKSNQQNYLNYDGVDGTYVWDASPGYLNATGSQFRLQTSMESVAEFRVNSGLAPAESGLGAGGNITVVSKSGGNLLMGSLFEYKRDDALDSASKYDGQKQELKVDQFGGSIGGPLARNRTFFFVSFEGLRQKTGLSFSEAVPSDEARRRILAGEPLGTTGGQSAARTQAVAPLLAGFPQGTEATANPLLAMATNVSQAIQEENAVSFRLDHRLSNEHSLYARYLYSKGEVDTPDRTATPRRVLAKQQPQNGVVNFQSLFGGNAVNEIKLGYNKPQTSARAFGPDGYPAIHVSLTGSSATSASIDGRGQTAVARSGLQMRATSAASGGGSFFDPHSVSISDALTWTASAHTFKFGGEYRRIESNFQFLGGTEYLFNSINDFIDNRPARLQINADSPVFTPQQYYLIGYAQDSWRASDRLTLELGLRYDFYSVVREKNDNAKPFFIEENDFSTDPRNFYDADKNNVSPRLSAAFRLNDRTVFRTGFGLFYGPGQFEDRIQPIENAISRIRVNSGDVPSNGLAYPSTVTRNFLQIRGYTHHRPDEYNMQYGASVSRELPGQVNLTAGYTGSRGRDMFIRGVANTINPATLTRLVPFYGEVDYKTSGCLDGAVINGNVINGCGRATYNAFQLSATRRFQSGTTRTPRRLSPAAAPPGFPSPTRRQRPSATCWGHSTAPSASGRPARRSSRCATTSSLWAGS
jgi:hypothetical protein